MKDFGKQIAVSIIAAIFVFGVGYALLSDTITVSGTASSTGTLNINVQSAVFSSSTGGGTAATQSVTTGDDIVTINVPALEYPGASVTFTITLINTGSIKGELVSITPTGAALTNQTDLAVTYSGIAVGDEINAANGTDTFTITATWLNSSTQGFTASPFSIELLYEQKID